MEPSRRFLVAGLAVAAVEVVLGIVALRTELALYFFACAAASAALAVITRRLLVRPRDDGPDEGRGGPPRGPDDPPPPPWWPEFEAQFRRHVRERARAREPVH